MRSESLKFRRFAIALNQKLLPVWAICVFLLATSIFAIAAFPNFLSGTSAHGLRTFELKKERLTVDPQAAHDARSNTRITGRLLISEELRNAPKIVVFPEMRVRANGFFVILHPVKNPSEKFETIIRPSLSGSYALLPDFVIPGEYELDGRGEVTSTRPVHAGSVGVEAFESLESQHERQGGLLVGGMTLLALFCLIISVINRDAGFLLLSAWLLTSLRLSAFNSGFDLQWMKFNPSLDDVQLINRVTICAHAALTAAIFGKVFRRLLSTAQHNSINWIGLAFLALGLASVAIPHTFFMQLFWLVSTGVLISTFCLAAVALYKQPAAFREVSWYLWSWLSIAVGILLTTSYSAGYSLILGTKEAAEAANYSISILSGLLTAVSFAAEMKRDRNERQAAQASAIQALKKYQLVYDASPNGLFSLAKDLSLTKGNLQFKKIAESISREAFLSPSHEGTFNLEKVFGRSFVEHLKNGDTQFEIVGTGSSDTCDCFEVTLQSGPNGFEGSIQDITARKRSEKQMEYFATHDVLTGVLNRRSLNQELETSIKLTHKGVSSALAIIDFQRLELISTYFGHNTGDEFLKKIAQRIRSELGIRHAIGRLADDSFLILIRATGFDDAEQIIHELVNGIGSAPFIVGARELTAEVRAGLVEIYPEMSTRDALAACDSALREAKKDSNSSIVSYGKQSAKLTSSLASVELASSLSSRLPLERLALSFQPIVSLKDPTESLSYEVLLRIKEGAKLVPPGTFLQAAERNGSMPAIDLYVAGQVFSWLAERPAHVAKLNYAAINLSGASLNDQRFIASLQAMVKEHHEIAKSICFEVTEQVAVNDVVSTRRFFDGLKGYGCRVALDDFGAGYSSFGYLRDFGADIIKIDGSYIQNLAINKANYAIVQSMINLAHQLGMKTVAEWAENAAIVELLLSLGADSAQGWGVGRPMDPSLLEHSLSSGELIPDLAIRSLLDIRTQPLTPKVQVNGIVEMG